MNELATPSDIDFDNGDVFVVVIDTNQYSGNFEREIAAFCLGAFAEYQAHGLVELGEFEEAMEREPLLESIKGKLTAQKHDEYGDSEATIWPTPNRLNDGCGVHFDAKEGETGWPAYESVGIFVETQLTAEEMNLVRLRAELYAEEYGKNLVIRGVRQIKVTTKRSVKTTVESI